MKLRVLFLSLMLTTTLAAVCNNPLAAYYEIDMLSQSQTQASDASFCKALNGKDSCCSTLKFAGQKAKKAFRKVNIETSRCLKQL
eukprot:CAMPEP_0114976610 /NCGR_PEP_ID=MMETSP0216-20121206/2767_1 /TAXON_ID=223996 /ORGANISM="Protocruzia adherens, Strain Boccale" /LENGTH=84 /DNA_ID=CAMNT_0002337555 /DNA_START=150 /DNA_END=401 /DNA_ORIENTATION=-